MKRNLNIVLALAAGVVGGFLSRYFAPVTAAAQSRTTTPNEIRAHSFVIVDAKDVPRGVFAIETTGFPTIEAMTEDGRVYRLTRQPKGQHPKPTLLPIQP